jgi:methionyl-tRNA formyltransferase
VLAQSLTPVLPDDNAGTLSRRLSVLGAELLAETLPGYLAGRIVPVPQDDAGSTYAPMLKKQDGALNFSRTAIELERQVRALYPWPGTFFETPRGALKVHRARAEAGDAAIGARRIVDGKPAVGTSQGLLVLESVQPVGKPSMAGDVYLHGVRDWEAAG